MRKVRGQLVLMFFLIQFVAMMLGNGLSALLSNRQVEQEIADTLTTQRLAALELDKRSDLNAQEITDVLSTTMTRMRIVSQEKLSSLDANQLQLLARGSAVSVRQGHEYIVYFALGGEVAAIEPQFRDARLFSIMLRGFFVNLLVSLIAIATLAIFSRRIVKPVTELSAATREVAAGNLDVQVAVEQKFPLLPQAKELTELSNNFNLMTRELKSIEYLRRDFTSSVSHEIKTPVASITGFARLLQENDLPPEERQDYTQAIIEESERLSRLAENLLRLTRLEGQMIQPCAQRFSLTEQLRQVIASLYPELKQKGLEVDVELSDVIIQADLELLAQLWLNLLGNAIKFTPEGGHIHVRLTQGVQNICVSIADSGIGMDEPTLDRIFEKFFQADVSRQTGGNGLGLSLVKRILDICGGQIDVRSSPGKGSTFTVRLPK